MIVSSILIRILKILKQLNMIPFQQSDEFAFGTPTTSQGYQIQDQDLLDDNLISFSICSSDKDVSKRNDVKLNRQRQKESRNESSSSSKKAFMHREVEKKRRQEMSNLHASLRSLLPDDQLKGKRSVCDQMQAAASHIKRMEKSIEELKNRRDELKSNCNSLRGNLESSSGVTINMGSNGMEILISHSIERSDLGLSRVLAELQCSELVVSSSVSTRVKERFVHKIQVEARDMTDLEVFVLQDRLSKAIK